MKNTGPLLLLWRQDFILKDYNVFFIFHFSFKSMTTIFLVI